VLKCFGLMNLGILFFFPEMQARDLIAFLVSYSLVGSCMSPHFPQMVSYTHGLPIMAEIY
jgi:hypothetical protein